MNLTPDYKWVLPAVFLLFLGMVGFTNLERERPWYDAVQDYQISSVEPAELARWVIEGRNDFVVVVLGADTQINTLPGLATAHTPQELARLLEEKPAYKTWVLLSAEGGPIPAQMAALATEDPERRVVRLNGGAPAWQEQIAAEELDWSQYSAQQTEDLKEVRAFFHQTAGQPEQEQYIAPEPVEMPFLKELPPPPKIEGC